MDDKLEKLIAINGVEGVFIFNNKAGLIYHALKRSLDEELIFNLGKHFLQLHTVQVLAGLEAFSLFELTFDKGNLISFYHDYYTIVIWATKSAQMNLVRLNANLIVSGLANDNKFKKMLKKNKIDRDYLLQAEYLDKHDEIMLSRLK